MLRGRLRGENLGDSIKLIFMQRAIDAQGSQLDVPVKIYRKECPEIPFVNDLAGMQYAPWIEYVDNIKMDAKGVVCIFEGHLPIEYSFSEYIDKDVEVGHKYVYWVEANSYGVHTVLGPLGMKVRSRYTWWPCEKATEKMRELEAYFPSLVTVKQYGESTRHKPMMGMTVGNQDKCVAIAGAVHATESSHEIILKMIEFMLLVKPSLFEKIGLAVLPCVSPDVRDDAVVGGEPMYMRLNANGVDLNRNFDSHWSQQFVYNEDNTRFGTTVYMGPYPNSEAETQTAIRFLESCNPIACFVFDGGSVITEDKLYYYCTKFVSDELFDYTTKLATLFSKTFRADHEGCGTFTAEPIEYPYEEPEFKNSGFPIGTMQGYACERFRIPVWNMQYAYSEEGRMRLTDDTTPELLQKWSIRQAYAYMAVLEELAKSDKRSW